MSIDILDELNDFQSFLDYEFKCNREMHLNRNQLLKTLSGLRCGYSMACLRDNGSNNRGSF